MEESRVKKSLLNARVNLIFYVLILLISFFSRKIFSLWMCGLRRWEDAL